MVIEIILTTILVMLLLHKWLVTSSVLKHVPGPMPWPVVGNTLQINHKNPYLTYIEISKIYGKTLRIRTTGRDVVVTSGRDEIHEVLVTKADDFADKAKMVRLGLSNFDFSGLAFMDYGEKYKLLRKIHSIGLNNHNLNLVEEVGLGAADEFINSARNQKGEAFDPHELVHKLVYHISMRFVLGKDALLSEKQRKEIEEVTSLLVYVYRPSGVLMDVFPWLRYFNTELMQKIQQKRTLIRKIYKDLLQTVPDESNGENPIFPATKRAWEKGMGDLTEENVMVFTVAEGMVAGTLSTVATFYSMLNKLASYSEVHEKVQKEITGVVGNRKVTLKDRENMPYSYACVLELRRFDSTTPVTRSHRTTKNTMLGKHNLPKGTDVLVNLWALHHDPEIWEKPLTFHPEHFLDKEGELLLPGEGVRAYEYPFGAGCRGCPADAYAKATVFLLLTYTCQNFWIKPATKVEEQVTCDSRAFSPGLVTRPPRYKIRMVPQLIGMEK